MNVLSIQSHVAYGHAGNSAAVFPLQRLGFEVWPVPSVVLSNHTGYPSARGGSLPVAMIAEILAGIAERGAFAHCDAVLTGYVGDPALVPVLADTVQRVKAANPQAVFCCDPVLGNDTAGLYVKAGVAEALKEKLVPLADIVTPNRFELANLAGTSVSGAGEARAAAEKIRRRGPRTVVCTSLSERDGEIAVLAADNIGAWIVRTPKIADAAHGAGDAFTAMFLGRHLRGEATGAALGHAVSSIYTIIEATAAAGLPELALIAAQDAIAEAPQRFPVDAA